MQARFGFKRKQACAPAISDRWPSARDLPGCPACRRPGCLAFKRRKQHPASRAGNAPKFNLDSRPHGRAQSHLFQIRPLGAGGLAFTTASTNALMFWRSRFIGEACLADAGLNDAGLFDAELDGAALGRLDTSLATSMVTVPTFGFGIRPRGPSTLPSRPTSAHHVRRGDGNGRNRSAACCTDLEQLLRADDVGTGLLRFLRLVTLGEHADADRAARAVRQVAPRRAPSGPSGADRRRGSPRFRRFR
jgi:hypothetical protein